MREKVLIVDDEQEFLDIVSERVRARGMEVSTTTSALDALKMVDEESFDAIVLDLMMPEMDGLEALKRLKKKKPEVQIILLTGHATVQKGIEAMKLGAIDFIEKPTDLQELTEAIKKARAHKVILAEKKTQETIKKIISAKAW
ncbi:MAG: response regulator [Desulfobacterales bacterium]|nr:MAG: response regulator [Desulfobacterales bacterium]